MPVDVEWSLQQMNEYRVLLIKHEQSVSQERVDTGAELDRRLTTVQAIAKAFGSPIVSSLWAQPVRGSNGKRHVTAALSATDILIGDLTNREAILRHLKAPAPQISADQLHPWVWQAAASLWGTNHRREAVQAAATLINAETQTKVGRRDVSDADLMNQVFSKNDPEPGKPRLRWPGDQSDLRVQSMNNGLRGFASGVFRTVRNAATHNPTDIPEQEALEQLSALSLLARWIEKCDVASAPTTA